MQYKLLETLQRGSGKGEEERTRVAHAGPWRGTWAGESFEHSGSYMSDTCQLQNCVHKLGTHTLSLWCSPYLVLMLDLLALWVQGYTSQTPSWKRPTGVIGLFLLKEGSGTSLSCPFSLPQGDTALSLCHIFI